MIVQLQSNLESEQKMLMETSETRDEEEEESDETEISSSNEDDESTVSDSVIAADKSEPIFSGS